MNEALIWLKEYRLAAGMTQSEVGEKAGISMKAYNCYETGRRSVKPPVAKRIAAVLGFDWVRFYSDDEQQ